jgi:hypothetical protein
VQMETQEQLPDDSGAMPVAQQETPKRDALAGVERLLSIADMQHAGVQKMVLDRLDRAEAGVRELERYRDQYYVVKEQLAVTASNLERVLSLDVLQSTMLGVGCMTLGFLPTAWGNWKLTVIAAIAGIGLVAGSYFSKARKRQ